MNEPQCGVHGLTMKLRSGTYGNFWSCPAPKDQNGNFCKFKAPKPLDAMREQQTAPAQGSTGNTGVVNTHSEMLDELRKISSTLSMFYAWVKIKGSPPDLSDPKADEIPPEFTRPQDANMPNF